MARSVARPRRSVGNLRYPSDPGFVRKHEFRSVAVEALMEMIAANDADNESDSRVIGMLNPNLARDRRVILELQFRIETRLRRNEQLREENARLERSRVA